jgi:CheY-like chemotaxis protein
MLERAGLRVRHAPDGAAALELLAGHAFDLVLMDCQMPVMDGLEATRQLRAREQAAAIVRTPVVALTASAMKEELEACRAAGMDECLTKPVVRAELDDVLARFTRLAQEQVSGQR